MILATCGYAGAQGMANTNNDSQTGNMRLVTTNAQLVRTVDSKNAAQGQIVTAKLTSSLKNAGTTELPKGTMLVGKVEQVKMSNNGGPGQLSIVFDQAQISGGKTVPIKATLLGAYPENTGDYWADTGTSGSEQAVQPRFIAADQTIDQEPGTLGHVALHSAVQSNASGVFINKDGNVDLKRGTRFQIAIAPETATMQQSGN